MESAAGLVNMPGGDRVRATSHGDTYSVEKALPVDGFRLAYERSGDGPAVVLLHGWPGDHTDYRDVARLISSSVDVVVPDLRGFGESDKHRSDPAGAYSADAPSNSSTAVRPPCVPICGTSGLTGQGPATR